MPAILLPEYRRYFLLSVFPNQGLDCYVLETSRVFFVKFPKLSVFQFDELLHFIDFRRKFIKMQNQFCLKTLGRNLQVLCCDLEWKSLICGLG
jgi:hypothetical protein